MTSFKGHLTSYLYCCPSPFISYGKSSIPFYFFNMNGGNKWTELNSINEYLWSQQSVQLALSWFPWKTNENDSMSIDGTIIQLGIALIAK